MAVLHGHIMAIHCMVVICWCKALMFRLVFPMMDSIRKQITQVGEYSTLHVLYIRVYR